MNIVYKVWATPVEMFVGDPELVDNPDYFHGFVPAWSKTDNYKVQRGKPFIPPVIKVDKFHDPDANGVWDEGEVAIAGWASAICLIAAGRCLSKKKHYIFCLVMAAISCLFMPFGTVLGVFTIIVLMQPAVKELFTTSKGPALTA